MRASHLMSQALACDEAIARTLQPAFTRTRLRVSRTQALCGRRDLLRTTPTLASILQAANPNRANFLQADIPNHRH